MKIPHLTKVKWDSLHDYGDFTAIAKESGFARQTIAGAFSGSCTLDVFQAVDAFYNKRQQMMEAAKNNANAKTKKIKR